MSRSRINLTPDARFSRPRWAAAGSVRDCRSFGAVHTCGGRTVRRGFGRADRGIALRPDAQVAIGDVGIVHVSGAPDFDRLPVGTNERVQAAR